MKFLHLSDVNLSNFAESDFGWEEDRERETKENLTRLLTRAEEDGIDLIMITGGLFSHEPVTSELEEAGDIFSHHPSIEIVIIAGGSDQIFPSSPLRSFIWPKNVHFVLSNEVERIVLESINTEIYASSVVNRATAPLSDFLSKASEKVESEGIKLSMIYEDPKKDQDFNGILSGFEGSDFSYVAVGGPQKYTEIKKDLIYASGALEDKALGERGTHGIIKGEIPLLTGRLSWIKFEEMAPGLFVTLNVKINSKANMKEISDSIESEIKKRGKNNIYLLNIKGMRNPDEKLNLNGISKKYRILKINDTSEPDYDYAKLFKDHPQDMIGFFISRVARKKERMSSMEKRAMFYGIDALISTSSGESDEPSA